jgi:hypothetical protein
VLCNVTHIARLRASLLDKTKAYAQHLSPTLLNNLVLIGCAILVKETVNLNKLKNHLGVLLDNHTTQTDSYYRRLTRFFHQPIAKCKLWKWLIQWMISYVKNWDGRSMTCYLTLDGTSWQFGNTYVHLLVLSLVYRGVSLPLYWVNLARKGHSSQRDRVRLIQQANKLYPLKGMCIVADREYVGKEWFKFLSDNQIQFIIRLTKEDYKHEISAGCRRYGSLLKSALNNHLCGQWFELGGHRYQFVALHHDDEANTTDPLVLLISNTSWSHRQIADRYRIRWYTECLFKHLKTNGFDLEELGMTAPAKIRLLVAIVVVLYVICVGEGFRQFHRIRGKYKHDPEKDFKARETVFRRSYSVVAREVGRVVQFIDWLLTRLDRPLRIPKRLIFITPAMNVQY